VVAIWAAENCDADSIESAEDSFRWSVAPASREKNSHAEPRSFFIDYGSSASKCGHIKVTPAGIRDSLSQGRLRRTNAPRRSSPLAILLHLAQCAVVGAEFGEKQLTFGVSACQQSDRMVNRALWGLPGRLNDPLKTDSLRRTTQAVFRLSVPRRGPFHTAEFFHQSGGGHRRNVSIE
jgi:hypothetical protein